MKNLDDITYTDELKKIIIGVATDLNIRTIAFTGGEPLMHDGLLNLADAIVSNTNIKRFTLTTNGTIGKSCDYWKGFYNTGLIKVSISMSDILELATGNMSDTNSESALSTQVRLVKTLNDIGIDVDVNVVVYNDFLYTEAVIRKLLKIKTDEALIFGITLLPNLLSEKTYNESQAVLRKIRSDMRFTLKSECVRTNTSNLTSVYLANNGTVFNIKSTKPDKRHPYCLDEGVCAGCNVKHQCQEGFYGLRLEQITDMYYVRLCLHREDSIDILMPYDDFLRTKTYKILRSRWVGGWGSN
jgi:molybdenum cofactor biosynthesis enzyme MoaA